MKKFLHGLPVLFTALLAGCLIAAFTAMQAAFLIIAMVLAALLAAWWIISAKVATFECAADAVCEGVALLPLTLLLPLPWSVFFRYFPFTLSWPVAWGSLLLTSALLVITYIVFCRKAIAFGKKGK